jgi:hypothetical protein
VSLGEKEGEGGAQTVYTHVSKCKNNKIKEKKTSVIE